MGSYFLREIGYVSFRYDMSLFRALFPTRKRAFAQKTYKSFAKKTYKNRTLLQKETYRNRGALQKRADDARILYSVAVS